MKQLNRHILKLLMLLVGLFAISNVGWAFVVYFDNSNMNWNTPYIHYWGGTTSSNWPGKAMNRLNGTIWYYEISNSTGLSFNSGGGNNKKGDFTAKDSYLYNEYGEVRFYSVPEPGIVGTGWSGSYWSTDNADYSFTRSTEEWWYKDIIPESGKNQIEFRIRYYDYGYNGQYQPNKDGNITLNTTNGTESETWGKNVEKSNNPEKPTGAFQISGVNSTTKYRIWFNTVSHKVKATIAGSVTPEFTLRGTWNNWSSATDQTYKFNATNDPLRYTLTVNSFPDDYHFRLYDLNSNSEFDYNDSFRGKNVGEWWDSGKHNYRIDTSYDKSKSTILFELILNADGSPNKLNIIILPKFNTDLSRKGKVYLVGNVINNNVPSPAWEMTGAGTSKTISNFAMRYNDNLGVVVYNESGVPTYYDMTGNVNQPTREVGGVWKNAKFSQAGWTYSATWNGSSLSLNPSTFNVQTNILPYVGILGQNFIQSTKHTTPIDFTGENGHTMGDTDLGWQEAYIEYGSNGAPILKSNNQAYYNTVWPPRNNILMQAVFDGDKLNVSSSELSLKPVTQRMTGAEWKKELWGTADNVKNEDYAGLDLESGKTYARYVVKNMWMQGPFKIWTGWGGNQASWGANWDTHVYWGPTDAALNTQNKKDDKGNRINNLDVAAGTTYDADNDGGNFNYLTKAREFFQTMELFIPIDKNEDNNNTEDGFWYKGAKLYMTEAPGGAKIDAVANNAEVGYYPSITSWPTGYKMTSYRITRYAYDSNIPSEEFADKLWSCTRKRDEAQYGSSAATVKTHNYGSYENGITDTEFKELFSKFWGKGGEYVLEGTYDPGRYIFRLEVTFTNQDGTKTKSADVWSPYVEIITTGYTTDLDTYQLIELPAGNKYTYMTYDPDGNYRGVNLKDDGESVASIESLKLSDDDAQEILEVTGKWTNKVLFVSRVPINFEQQTADLKEIRSFTVVDGNETTTKILDLKPYEDNKSYYMAVKNLSDDLKLKQYKSAFTGYIELAGENNTSSFNTEGTMDTPVEYYPHFMLPAFGKALLSFDADGNKTKKFTASHEDITTLEGTETQQEGITTNRHMLQADIEVLMPNISTAEGTELKEAVFEALFYNISKNDPDGGESTSYPISADNTKSEFGLSYKYQNPYDWMKYAKGQGIDGCDWIGKTHEWTITGAKYADNTAISGIEPTLNGWTATITAKPAFKAPDVSAQDTAYGYSFKEDETTGWTIFDVWIEQSNIGINNDDNFDTNDNTDVKMGQDENVAFLVKVVLDEKYLKENQDLSIISQVMPYKTAKDPTVRHSILHLYRWYDQNYYTYINELMKKLQIEVAYAYYFSAGGEAGTDSNDASLNAKISTSDYIGLSSTKGFPNIRYDHQDGQKNGKMSVKRRAEGEYGEDKPSETLTKGDNAFLLAPQYTVIKYANDTDNGIPTGIEGIGYDNAGSIRAGQGFIEVEGQSVAIYNASGICIATAEGRYDVAPGVYVVRLNGATSKVLVK